MERPNFNFTPHFTYREMTDSATARRLGISNEPGLVEMDNLQHLCSSVLEPLRAWYGQPVLVTSGYRSEELNYRVGGVGDSAHIHGAAADLHIRDTDEGRSFYWFIKTRCRFDQLLWEYGRGGACWIHVASWKDGSGRANRMMDIPNYRVRNA